MPQEVLEPDYTRGTKNYIDIRAHLAQPALEVPTEEFQQDRRQPVPLGIPDQMPQIPKDPLVYSPGTPIPEDQPPHDPQQPQGDQDPPPTVTGPHASQPQLLTVQQQLQYQPPGSQQSKPKPSSLPAQRPEPLPPHARQASTLPGASGPEPQAIPPPTPTTSFVLPA